MTTAKVKSLENTQKAPESASTSRAFTQQPGVGVSQNVMGVAQGFPMAGNQAVQQLFRSGHIQAKLAISQPGDPEEEEADRVADQVMRMAEPAPISSAPGSIQRKCAACEAGGATCTKCEEEQKIQRKEKSGQVPQSTPAINSQIATLRGAGQSLQPSARALFEPRFGHDFSQVRIHTDGAASRSAESFGALAYTHGSDIVFRHGQYAPDSPSGQRLLAHELTHIVQQAASPPRVVQRQAAPAVAPQPAGPANAPSAAVPVGDERIDLATRTGDPGVISSIPDFSKVPKSERLRFIRILNGETSEAISGGHIIRLWQSFGDNDLPAVVMANRDAWDYSVHRFGGDPMVILPYSLVSKRNASLESDLKALAEANLKHNQDFVDLRMQQFGLKPGAQKEFSEEDITKVRRAVQEISWNVWTMRQSQKKLENASIGRQLRKPSSLWGIHILMGSEEEEVRFNPRVPPTDPELLEVWKSLKEDWDKAQKGVTEAAGAYPEIYEAVVSENDDKLQRLSRVTPDAFTGEQRTLLQALLDRIVSIQNMVSGGELDLLAMKPAVTRLTGGGGKWATGFDNYMAELLLAQHEKNAETMRTVLKFAPLLLAPIASTGIGVILEAVAIGASIAVASAEYKQASAQAEVARATPISGTELVERAPADAAKAKALAELVEASVLAIIVAIGAGIAGATKLVEGIRMARLRAVIQDESLLTRLLAKISDKSQLHRIATKVGDVSKLEELITAIPNPERLEALLTRAGDGARLSKLLEKLPNPERLAKLLETADGPRLEIMLERLGSVENVEGAFARQARGEAEGLLDESSMARLAKETQGTLGRWNDLSPQQRLDEALVRVNAELQVQGVPPIKAKLFDSASSSAGWSTSMWQAEVNGELVADVAKGPGELAKSLYHEARHAEQDFLVARLQASQGMTAEKMTMQRTEGGLFIPENVAREAVARPLPSKSPQADLARDLANADQKFQKGTDGGLYNRIMEKRTATFSAWKEAELENFLAKNKALRETGQLDTWTPEVQAAFRREKEAKEAFDIADQVYRNVPFEKDAFAVTEEFEKHLAASQK